MNKMTTVDYNCNLKIWGDRVNILTLVLGALYATIVVFFAKPGSRWVDEDWIRDGFCVSNKDKPYWTSHDWCFYISIVLASCLCLLYRKWRHEPGMEEASKMIPMVIISFIAHGAAHEFHVAYRTRKAAPDEISIMEGEPPGLGTALVLAPCFWFPMLKSYLPKRKLAWVGMASLLISLVSLLFPVRYGFAYTTLVLLVTATADQLLSPFEDKRVYFAASVLGVPVIIADLFELLWCNGFYKKLGGHALTDTILGVSGILVFAYQYYYREIQRKKQA